MLIFMLPYTHSPLVKPFAHNRLAVVSVARRWCVVGLGRGIGISLFDCWVFCALVGGTVIMKSVMQTCLA